MSYNIYAFDGELNHPAKFYRVHNDTFDIVLNVRTRTYADSALTGKTAKLYVAELKTEASLMEVDGVIDENTATFTIDTSELPSAGDYRYIIKITASGTTYTIIASTFGLFLNVA